MRDLTMENPIRAIREISPRHDRPAQGPAGQRPRGQRARHPAASTSPRPATSSTAARSATPLIERALDLWERGLKAVESDDLGLVEREIDWVIKWKLIERYRAKHGLPLGHPRIAQLDLAYHDIHRGRGLYYLLEKRGAVTRVTTDLQIFEAKSVPPQTTRARLRGEFIKQGPGAAPRLHRRLGAPQAQRPGPAHGAVQGPVPGPRRAGAASSSRACSRSRLRRPSVQDGLSGAAGYRGRARPSRLSLRCSFVRRLLVLLLASADAASPPPPAVTTPARRRPPTSTWATRSRGLTVSGAFGSEPKVTVKPADQGRQADDPGDLRRATATRWWPTRRRCSTSTSPRAPTGRSSTAAPTRAPRPRSTMNEKRVLQGHHRRPGRQAAGLAGRDRRDRQGRVGRGGRAAAEAEDQRHGAVRHRRALGRAEGRRSTPRRARRSPRRPSARRSSGERRQGHRHRLLQGPQEGPDASSRSSRSSRATARRPRPAGWSTFNYYGAVYGSKKPFDSSFSRGAPVPFGVGVKGLIPAWDKVIPGLKQGSRVLIIAPPGDAYGARAQSGIPANSTLTFVVDVLGVDS